MQNVEGGARQFKRYSHVNLHTPKRVLLAEHVNTSTH